MRRIEPHEYGWEFAKKIEKLVPHRPEAMRSGESTGPLKMWICNVPGCGRIERTITLDPPVCEGGYPWSFSTREIFS